MKQLQNHPSSTLFCFSPAVMLATFFVETALLLYALIRYRRTAALWISLGLLTALATFQLAEYVVCETALNHSLFSRIGFIAITMLPPLGTHLLWTITQRTSIQRLFVIYGLAAVWVSIYAFGNALSGHSCQGNYVIFRIGSYSLYYSLYYFGLIAFTIAAAWSAARRHSEQRITLLYFILCYLMFLVPTSLVVIINPDTLAGVPSIMCGFAAVFAVLLTLVLLPRITPRR